MSLTNKYSKEFEWLLKEKYNGIQTEEFLRDVVRIEQGEPIDYVIGFSKFLGTHIDLEYKPLIPRTETEYWVEKAMQTIKNKFGDSEIQVLDMFAGSGCIGIAILKHIPNVRVDFVDIDVTMTQQIQKNLELNNISKDRYRIFTSNMFETIDTEARYDVVFANPPYIDKSRNVTDDSVVMHEPHIALFAENKGMQIIEKFITEIKSFLKPECVIFVEHDDDQVERIKTLLVSQEYRNYYFHIDQFGLPRWIEILS